MVNKEYKKGFKAGYRKCMRDYNICMHVSNIIYKKTNIKQLRKT